jgi:DNA-binding beta-propeller fold protein YncE
MVAPGGDDLSARSAVDDFSLRAAKAVCDALYRCCDDDSRGTWFGGYVSSYEKDPIIKQLAGKLPPKAVLPAGDCPDLVRQMFDAVPFGSWIEQVHAGRVVFDATGAQGCIDALDHAACGSEVSRALFDGTCLSFAPPGGGVEQRRMFKRTQAVGADCAPIRDGIGAMFYGTCDPTAAFCCITDPAHPADGCVTPGAGKTGQCARAASVGQACRSFPPPLLLCATGLECAEDTAICEAPSSAPLAAGAVCADTTLRLLGICQQSFCDLLGSKKCEPLRADGVACQAGFECEHGSCNGGVCGRSSFCVSPASIPDGGAALPDGAALAASAGTLAAGLKGPVAVAVDQSGGLWASFDDHVVRMLDRATGAVLLTVGSSGTFGFSDSPPLFKSPAGLAVDVAGAVYVADSSNHAIRKITPGASGATVSTLVSGTGKLNRPADVVLDENGDVLVADTSNCAIKRLHGGALATLIDNSDALGRACFGNGRIYYPRGLAYDAASKRLYVSESLAHRIDLVDLAATPVTAVTIAGTGSRGADDGSGTQATFDSPGGLALDGTGALLVADRGNHRLRRVVLGAMPAVVTWAGGASGDVDGPLAGARFNEPSDVAMRAGAVFVADRMNDKIRKIIP